MVLHAMQVRSRIGISKRSWAVGLRRRLREDTRSTEWSIVRKGPIIGMYCTGWGMCFVVVCYYNRVRNGLRNQPILVVFDSENDTGSSQ